MRNLTVSAFCFLTALTVAYVAWGQDKTDVLRESNVSASALRTFFLADGGCAVSAEGTAHYDGGMKLTVQSDAYPYNGPGCTAARTAALRAVKKEVGVGNGALP